MRQARIFLTAHLLPWGLSLAVALSSQPMTLHAAPIETHHLQSLGDVEYQEFRPEGWDRSFHVFVDLPEDYATSTSRYPVIYLLDGGNTFPLLAAQHHFLRFGEEVPAAILVGLSYGADTFRQGNMRLTDYTAPSEKVAFWGGAERFRDVLEGELIPMIEQAYRADSSQRILFGHSAGAQFVLVCALTRPELFFGYIAINPALTYNLPFFLKWQGVGAMPSPAARLFVGMSEYERPDLRAATERWRDTWQARPERPWTLDFRIIAGQSHLSVVPDGFTQGLQWLLPEAMQTD